jgi:hypothetical protein
MLCAQLGSNRAWAPGHGGIFRDLELVQEGIEGFRRECRCFSRTIRRGRSGPLRLPPPLIMFPPGAHLIRRGSRSWIRTAVAVILCPQLDSNHQGHVHGGNNRVFAGSPGASPLWGGVWIAEYVAGARCFGGSRWSSDPRHPRVPHGQRVPHGPSRAAPGVLRPTGSRDERHDGSECTRAC